MRGTLNKEIWLSKVHLGKIGSAQERAREMYTGEEEGRRHSGRGGSRFKAYALSKVKIAKLGIRP